MLLPYRTDGADLERLVDALARGRTLDQVQTLNFSQKGFEGTVTAAEILGFAARDEQALTPRGRDFALASEQGRKGILLNAILQFEPYSLLLDAIEDRGDSVTETGWIETWWSTHGFGTSASNRSEGSSTFARFLEYAGMGSYTQGRRGHPSRIEWKPGAFPRGRSVAAEADPNEDADPPGPVQDSPRLAPAPRVQPRTQQDPPASPSVELSMPLSDGRSVYIRLPHTLSEGDKKRILTLIEHLVTTESSDSEGG